VKEFFFGMGSTTLYFMDVGGERKPAWKEFIAKLLELQTHSRTLSLQNNSVWL